QMFWLWIAFFSVVSSRRITQEENRFIAKICGNPYLNPRLRAYEWKNFKQNRFPWAASIQVGDKNCSGTLISHSHVLTAASCIYRTKDVQNIEECFRLDYNNKRRYESVSWNITIGSDCPGCNRHTVSASKVLVPEDFNECTKENDIAIFELREKLLGTWAQPICLPERNEPISYSLQVAAGNPGSHFLSSLKTEWLAESSTLFVKEGENPNGKYKLEGVTFVRSYDDRIEVEVPKGKELGSGYGGGPLFQLNDNNKFVQVGIASELGVHGKNKEQLVVPFYDIEDDSTDVFTDLRKHLNWICCKIGLCYRENIFKTAPTFLETTTTIPYDPSGWFRTTEPSR
uniref:Peptidase S1 domain-containing protein n=1 Tax=Haemonchus contortus TaxID=6289 RepID=A0A7I5E752_HAECO